MTVLILIEMNIKCTKVVKCVQESDFGAEVTENSTLNSSIKKSKELLFSLPTYLFANKKLFVLKNKPRKICASFYAKFFALFQGFPHLPDSAKYRGNFDQGGVN